MWNTARWLLGILLGLLLVILWLREPAAPAPATVAPQASPEREPRGQPSRAPLAAHAPESIEAAASQAAPQGDPLVLANNQGAEYLKAGDLDAALERFEHCHAQDPEREVFRSNLSEALLRSALRSYGEHDLEGALGSLQRAVQLDVTRPQLQQLLARWLAEEELELDHWSVGSELLELSYDVHRPDLRESAPWIMEHLERVYGDLQLWFGVDPVRDLGLPKIRVVLYGDQGFDRLTGLGDWASGVFDGVVRIAVGERMAELPRWRQTMAHELVHAYIFALGGNGVPGWLNEGLAQLLESERPELERARRILGSQRFALADLKESLASWSDLTQIPKAYAQSLLFVELIRFEHGTEALRRMIVGCKSGHDPAEVFEGYAQVPLDSLLEFLR